MACVYDPDAPPPPELRLVWMCGEYHLPDQGAILDQDYVLMRRMRAADNVFKTLDRMRNLTGAQIHSLTIGERKLIRALRDGGYIG